MCTVSRMSVPVVVQCHSCCCIWVFLECEKVTADRLGYWLITKYHTCHSNLVLILLQKVWPKKRKFLNCLSQKSREQTPSLSQLTDCPCHQITSIDAEDEVHHVYIAGNSEIFKLRLLDSFFEIINQFVKKSPQLLMEAFYQFCASKTQFFLFERTSVLGFCSLRKFGSLQV